MLLLVALLLVVAVVVAVAGVVVAVEAAALAVVTVVVYLKLSWSYLFWLVLYRQRNMHHDLIIFQVFGLHPNADITYQTKTAVDVLDTIVNIQPKDAGGSTGETRESVVFRQASEMLDKLPEDYIPHEVGVNPICLW